MKQLTRALVLFFIAGSTALSAQKIEAKPPAASGNAVSQDDAVAREAAEKLAAKYSLNADQAKQVYTIEQRKQRNLAEIEPLKTSDRSRYLAKLESLQKGTLNSIKRTLHTKEQLDLFQSTQADVRTKRAEKRKELLLAKSSKEDIQAVLLEIYEE
ncbi:MAG: hypothetical protein KA165_02660 [Saprospiraceae bacterium]|nr:hypothetical protein [Saprospiraceae bacterium]